MNTQEIDDKKAEAFNQIRDILLDLPDNTEDGPDHTDHILDVLEQLMARIIASSSLEPKQIEEMCEDSMKHIEAMAKEFLEEEMKEAKEKKE